MGLKIMAMTSTFWLSRQNQKPCHDHEYCNIQATAENLKEVNLAVKQVLDCVEEAVGDRDVYSHEVRNRYAIKTYIITKV